MRIYSLLDKKKLSIGWEQINISKRRTVPLNLSGVAFVEAIAS
jgi:hypothetical protein